MTAVGPPSDFNVRLIPRETKAPLEVRIGLFIRQEWAVLDRKEIKVETRLESIEIQKQSVVEFAANDRRPGPRLFIRGFPKAIDKLGFGTRSKMISLILS